MEELISRISRKIADGSTDQIWISKFDLDYAYGQLQLSKHALDLCIFAITGGNSTGFYRFFKGLNGLSDIPKYSRKDWPNTGAQTSGVVTWHIGNTKRTKEQHKRELIEVLKMLKDAGYRLTESQTDLFKTEIEWVGNKIDQNSIRPLQDKLKAIQELKEPKNEKELKSVLGQFRICQNSSKICRHSQTYWDSFFWKKNNWNWTTEHSEAINQLKRKITEKLSFAYYSSVWPNTITTDASTKGLGSILWQEQYNRDLIPIVFARRFLSDTENKYVTNELKLLAVVWRLEHFRLYIYWKPVK